MTDEKLDQEVKQVGFWWSVRRLGSYRFIEVVWPEVLLGLAVGVGGAALAVRGTTLDERIRSVGDVLPLAGALAAIVFAALAIMVSLPSRSYLRDIHQTSEGGMRRFLDPFLVALGVQVAIILLAIGYRLVAKDVAWRVEHVAFYVLGFIFVLGLLEIASLGRQLVRHGVLRAYDAALGDDGDEEEQGGTVRRLPERR